MFLKPSQEFWVTGGIRPFISGEQGNKTLQLKDTGEQRKSFGTGNIENQDYDFWEQGKRTPRVGRTSFLFFCFFFFFFLFFFFEQGKCHFRGERRESHSPLEGPCFCFCATFFHYSIGR